MQRACHLHVHLHGECQECRVCNAHPPPCSTTALHRRKVRDFGVLLCSQAHNLVQMPCLYVLGSKQLCITSATQRLSLAPSHRPTVQRADYSSFSPALAHLLIMYCRTSCQAIYRDIIEAGCRCRVHPSSRAMDTKHVSATRPRYVMRWPAFRSACGQRLAGCII